MYNLQLWHCIKPADCDSVGRHFVRKCCRKLTVMRFSWMCGTVQRMLENKTRKDTEIKFYKLLCLSMGVKTGLWLDLKGEKLKQQKCAF
jgi:hypothetical protein